MTLRVPSVSIVGPTSFVFPPSDTITPVVSFVMHFATSAAFVTEPWITVRLRSAIGFPAFASPAVPGGCANFDGVRARTVTLEPRASAWTTHSDPVAPVPPMTTMLDLSAGVAAARGETTARRVSDGRDRGDDIIVAVIFDRLFSLDDDAPPRKAADADAERVIAERAAISTGERASYSGRGPSAVESGAPRTQRDDGYR
eukprot:29202-Pelagococcus_subviridis.AAC.2